MKKIKFVIETGFVGCDIEDVAEFNDDVTEEELDEYLDDLKNNIVGTYYEIDDDEE